MNIFCKFDNVYWILCDKEDSCINKQGTMS